MRPRRFRLRTTVWLIGSNHSPASTTSIGGIMLGIWRGLTPLGGPTHSLPDRPGQCLM